MTDLPLELFDLASRQSLLLTRKQLATFGVTAREIDYRCRALEWQLVTPRVVKLDITPVTREQERNAAVLHHENLYLTGAADLERFGFKPSHDRRIDLIGPRGTRIPSGLNVVLHTVRRPVTVIESFPRRTTPTVTVVNAMAWADTQAQAHHFGYRMVREGHTTVDDLFGVVLSNKFSQISIKARGRVLTMRQGVDTVHEHKLLKLCKEGLGITLDIKPAFEIADGILIHPDFGLKVGQLYLAIEADGSHHFSADGQLVDAYRMQGLADIGVETFRTSNAEIDDNPQAVLRALGFVIERLRKLQGVERL